MKLLESSEKRYDMGMNMLTMGFERRVKAEIASKFVSDGSRVFEIGVGTGTLAISCARRGASLVGIDISSKMLAVAERKVREAGLGEQIELRKMSVVEMDHLPEGSFDAVLATFVLSELSEDEQRFAVRESWRILRADGRMIILDEAIPRSRGKRIIYYLIRIPLVAVTYLYAQTATSPLRSIETKLSEVGFKVEAVSRYLLSSLQLIVASKEE